MWLRNCFFERQAQGLVDLDATEVQRSIQKWVTNGQRLQRRLFTEDTVRGFAFVDLCHKWFDVVLMNPPFGDGSKLAKALVEKQYPRTKTTCMRPSSNADLSG